MNKDDLLIMVKTTQNQKLITKDLLLNNALVSRIRMASSFMREIL